MALLMLHRWIVRWLWLALPPAALLLMACYCVTTSPLAAEEEGAATPAAIEQFEKQVRPLLVEHCQKCHGAKKQEGELRLDSRAGLLAGGEHGAVVAPGVPDKSRLITAIGYSDDDLQMPPDGKLPAEAIVAITQWVREGAIWPERPSADGDQSPAEQWKTHWAAQPVHPQELPAVGGASSSPIDRFILARLEAAGLAPSPPADRPTLLRRATFDLTGLPPTSDEIAAFEADRSPDAFAKVVERLLASPHYGERWGRHWLDVARYADTKEYVRLKEERRYLFAFAYRDYVVQSFNDDLPYDQFIREQLAADLLTDGDRPRRLAALGFLTLGRNFTGNPHDVIDDRIDVTTRGLLGLTVTCARCHDHKYDPIPTADYYSLYGIFASSEVPGVPPLAEEPPTSAKQQPQSDEIAARQRALEKYQDEAHRRLVEGLRSNVGGYLIEALEGRRRFLVPLPAAPGEVRHFVAERWLDYLEDPARASSPEWIAWHALAAIEPNDDFAGRSSAILATLGRRDGSDPAAPRANSLVLAALEREQLGSMADVARVYGDLISGAYRQMRAEIEPENLIVNGSFEDNGAAVNVSPSGWELEGSRFSIGAGEGATSGGLAAIFGDGTAEGKPPTAHTATISQSVGTRPGASYRLSFDFASYGSGAESHGQKLGIRVLGRETLVERTLAGLGNAPAKFENTVLDFVADGPSVTIRFSDQTDNGESGFADGVLDNVALVELSPVGVPLVATHNASADDPEHRELLAMLMDVDSPTNVTWIDAVDCYLYDSPIHDHIMGLRQALNEAFVQAKLSSLRAHALSERPMADEPRILLRGDPSRHGPPVSRHSLSALADEEQRPLPTATARLELARAIASATNPLTARVMVNRVWQHHFGSGLVASSSNFGLRGQKPSHPELLDYLAQRFASEGWSIKQLHRLIMLSNTYQQSSDDRPDAAAVDPENRLLARMNRQRLDVEALRDAMLAASGELDLSVGGPPVDLAALDCHRRTLYGLVDRQNLVGMLRDFDFASPDAHTPARHVTTVPQQALFLLNGPTVLERAKALAQRVAGGTALPEERITAIFRLALGRAPTAEESRSARAFLDAGGSWPDFAQVILVSNEFGFVD